MNNFTKEELENMLNTINTLRIYIDNYCKDKNINSTKIDTWKFNQECVIRLVCFKCNKALDDE